MHAILLYMSLISEESRNAREWGSLSMKLGASVTVLGTLGVVGAAVTGAPSVMTTLGFIVNIGGSAALAMGLASSQDANKNLAKKYASVLAEFVQKSPELGKSLAEKHGIGVKINTEAAAGDKAKKPSVEIDGTGFEIS